MNTNFLFGILIFHQIKSVLGWKYQVVPTKAKSESLTDKVKINISITDYSGLSLYMELKEDLHDLFTTVNLAVNLHTTDEYDFHLIKRTVDCCKLFTNPLHEPEVQIFYKMFSENGHFPVGCPVKKDLYYLSDDIIKVDHEQLPQLLAETKKALLTINHSVKERNKFKVLAKYQIYFTVEKIGDITIVTDGIGTTKDIGPKFN